MYLAEDVVPQSSTLSSLMYTLYTENVSQHLATLLASFAYDKVILATHQDSVKIFHLLNLSLLQPCFSCWRLSINAENSVHTNSLSTLASSPPPIMLNYSIIPTSPILHYLKLHLEKRLTWKRSELSLSSQNVNYQIIVIPCYNNMQVL